MITFLICNDVGVSGTNTTIIAKFSNHTASHNKNVTSLIISINQTSTTTPATTQTATNIPPGAICHHNYTIHHDMTIPSNSTCHSYSDPQTCFHDPVKCEKHFSSKRTIGIPIFGEYEYLAHRKWFTVIQHGGIVFLYHPCISTNEKQKLQMVARSCLRRYVLTPSEILNVEMPIALVSWGCFHGASHVNTTAMRAWLRNNSFNARFHNLHTLKSENGGGRYKKNLLRKSLVVTDEVDTIVCPTEQEMEKFHTTTTTITTKKLNHKKIGEKIINERMHAIQYKHTNSHSTNFTATKVHAGNATWAAASLFFLCGILVSWLIYTKLYSKHDDKPQTYDYRQVYDENDLYGVPGNSFSRTPRFNLLKSSQRIIDIFKTPCNQTKYERKLDSLSSVNLMVPINEDEEEYDD